MMDTGFTFGKKNDPYMIIVEADCEDATLQAKIIKDLI